MGSWDSKDGLEISDIVWPGNSPAPPQGRPDKFHLNIATLDDEPFVIIKMPGTDKQLAVAPFDRQFRANSAMNF